MKLFVRIIAIILSVALMLSLCACSDEVVDTTSTVDANSSVADKVEEQDSNLDASSTDSQVASSNNTPSNNSSIVENNSSETSNVSSVESEVITNSNASAQPTITLFAPVANDIFIIGGSCSNNTEYIQISGDSVKTQKVVPARGKDKSYFTAQVKVNTSDYVFIQTKEKGKDLSGEVKKYVNVRSGITNMMTSSDYQPVFGLDSRIHFYSAILTYSKSNFLSSAEKQYAKQNISDTVKAAKSVGAEVIYLVVPSSAAVYPESVPSEYKAASGETLYKSFKSIAEESGATVLYPLDDMKAHKNDGDGYKIYSHSDSHWTTYGAYFGVNSLMTKISAKYPSAKPRTVSEMGFYTTELYGGDALFSFGDYKGFENYSDAASTKGETSVTGIMELTTLYNLKMPTDTLTTITRGKKSIYLTKDNADKYDFTNKNGSGLPTAVITRDSFGRTTFDMVNDRFSEVTWLAENDFSSTISAIEENKPNYVIYIVSERNLYKVMMNNSNMSLVNLFK
ncbi:MAG: hypothetical protein IKT42_06640 [Clostridia bacterium]|nr:hypothetical protein [Clostridia bacterium]